MSRADSVMKQKRIWALVANGAAARILKGVYGSEPVKTMEFRPDHPRLGEIMSDRAGRSFSSVGRHRSAMEPRSDPVEERQRLFADSLSALLEEHHASDDFDELIVIAAPAMLGDLRQAFDRKLQDAITHEVDKDLTKQNIKKLMETVRKIAQDRP